MSTIQAGKSAAFFAALFLCAAIVACGGGQDAVEAATPAPPPAAPGPSPGPSPAPTPPPPAPGSADPCPATAGRTLEVGPGKPYPTPSAAAAAAETGDRILIAPGDYRGDVATWRAANLTICGDGGRARLFADGRNAQGKGIWVISVPSSATTTIVNVEFRDAKVPDQNGAGIRLEGGNLILRNTGFFDNENGILGGAGPTAVTIERSEFARNGYGDGYSHNIYIGNVDRLHVVASWFHEARVGHNLKSRAKENVVENSYFMDGPNGNSSYLLDFPDGGVVFMRGNLLQKGPNADNSVLVAYGFERNTWTTNTVTLVHNTLVTNYGSGTFIGVAGFTQQVTLTANLFAGSATMASGAGGKLQEQNNVMTGAANVPGASSGQFWPAAGILAQLDLTAAPDPQYANDSPQPFVLRSLAGVSGRKIGALQSSP